MPNVFLGLGSNQAQPAQQIERAMEKLRHLPDTRCIAVSSFYTAAAIGPDQDDFINAVIQLDTSLPPLMLLTMTQALETEAGRTALADRQYWGPRPLDIDILLYGDSEIGTETLTVPHPRIGERRFVLEPLLEIAPNLQLPNSRQPLHNLIASCADQRVDKIR